MSSIRVKKRNGKLEDFNVEKINICAERACYGISDVSHSELVLDTRVKFFDKIKTSDIDNALIDSAREKIIREPNWSLVAARLLLNVIYKEVLKESIIKDTFESDYRSQFVKNIRRGVKLGYYDERLLDFDLKKIANAINLSNDYKLRYMGVKFLYDRYLSRIDGVLWETPQYLFMRVAMGLAINEGEAKDDVAISFYEIYSSLRAMPSTPTLFNSGRIHSQTASCYLNTFEDSLDGIFDGAWQEARKSKWAGGLGMDVTPFRATGSIIKGTNGKSNGAIPWIKVLESVVASTNQGGKRKGSGAVYMEPWHYDFERFLDLRKGSGDEWSRTHNLNTAAWIPDEFMKRVELDQDWYMFSPSDCPDLHELYGDAFSKRYAEYIELAKNGQIMHTVIKAKELWKKHLRMLFETGHPWVTFKDPSNMRYSNQHSGVVHSSNLCTEILLQTKASQFDNDGNKTVVGETAVCQLSSVNLIEHCVDGKVDYELLQETVSVLTRAIDNAIDINFYPTEESKAHLKHRPIGIGSMGFQDVAHYLNIIIDSEDGTKLAKEIQENIAYAAILASSKLAKERGRYETYEGSLWDQGVFPQDTYITSCKLRGLPQIFKEVETLDWSTVRNHVKEHGMRNSNTMAIAPTASISYVVGCEQSIEPSMSVVYAYGNLSGTNMVINSYVYFKEDMIKEGLWNSSTISKLVANNGDVTSLDIPDFYKKKYAPVMMRDRDALIRSAAARQIFIDQGQSFNLYYNGSSLKEIHDMYMACWKYGLKTTYYCRNQKDESIKKTVSAENVPTTVDNTASKEATDSSDLHGMACVMEEGCISCQ